MLKSKKAKSEQTIEAGVVEMEENQPEDSPEEESAQEPEEKEHEGSFDSGIEAEHAAVSRSESGEEIEESKVIQTDIEEVMKMRREESVPNSEIEDLKSKVSHLEG